MSDPKRRKKSKKKKEQPVIIIGDDKRLTMSRKEFYKYLEEVRENRYKEDD